MLKFLSNTIRKNFTGGHPHNAHSRMSSVDSFGSPAAKIMMRSAMNTGMLNEELLHELLSAGLNAAGFSEKQRWELYEIGDYARHHFLLSPLLQSWPFEVVGRKARKEEDVVKVSFPRFPNPS